MFVNIIFPMKRDLFLTPIPMIYVCIYVNIYVENSYIL